MLTPERLAAAAGELAAAEQALLAASDRLAERARRLDRVAEDSTAWWLGDRADRYRTITGAAVAPFRPIRSTVIDATKAIARIRHLADELAALLATTDRSRTQQLDLLTRVRRDVDGRWSRPGDEVRLVGTVRALDLRRADIEVRWSTAAESAADAINRVAMSIPTEPSKAGFAHEPLGPLGRLLGGRLPGGVHDVPDPSVIGRWWRGLTPATRAAVIRTLPSIIGNLDGVPLAARASANRRAMQQVLDGALPGSKTWDTMQQFADGTDRGSIDPLRRFVVFDPAGDGVVAEAFGDVAAADHVAVIVPGMGSTLANFHDLASRSARLHRSAGSGSAVIAWTGYDTPHAPVISPTAFEVVSDRQATHGGARLRAFVDGLGLGPTASITLIGHSYGSLTVGKALQDGVRVDRVVFTGSPGVGADRVTDFPHASTTEFFASEIKGDVVANLERFGSNPTDPDFGARVFDSGDGDGLDPLSRHGEYYDAGIAIENLATIMTGGSPTPGRTDLIEYLTEPLEDIDDAITRAVDRVREFDIPLVDDTVIDRVTLAAQRADETLDQAREIVVEEFGHFGQDAVEWGAERVGDTWNRGFDVLPRWAR